MAAASEIPNGWVQCEYQDFLEYIQPTKYIVDSAVYNDMYDIPVLTAGKSFIKGYTNEKHGVFNNTPVIIFDDFTTASKYVNFPFKVKSSAMKILVPSCKMVNLTFMFYLMQVNKIRSDTHKRYWISVYAKKSLFIPPLNEQRRIVEKIEELFSELDKGIESLKIAREQLNVYRQALLKSAFEGKLTEQWRKDSPSKLETADELLVRIQKEREDRYQLQLGEWNIVVEQWVNNGKEGKKPLKPKKYMPSILAESGRNKLDKLPEGWRWVFVSELLYSIRGGTTVPPTDERTDFPILRSSSVRSGFINAEDVRYIQEENIKSEQDFVSDWDLLFTRLNGTIDFVGNCAVVRPNLTQRLMYPDRLYCAKLVNNDLALYCEYFFASPVVRKYIEDKAKSTAGHKRISIPDITDMPIQLAGIDEVHKIIGLLEEKLPVIRKNELDIEDNIKRSEALRQSILKKAFSGKLVLQNPNDEPASELLKRIVQEKTEIEAQLKSKKASKKKTSKKVKTV